MASIILSLSLDPSLVELIQKCKIKCMQEGKTWNLSKLLAPSVKHTLTKYIENYGDGNPSSTIDQFVDNPKFSVTPALMRDNDIIENFIAKIPKERQKEIQSKIIAWNEIIDRHYYDDGVECTRQY